MLRSKYSSCKKLSCPSSGAINPFSDEFDSFREITEPCGEEQITPCQSQAFPSASLQSASADRGSSMIARLNAMSAETSLPNAFAEHCNTTTTTPHCNARRSRRTEEAPPQQCLISERRRSCSTASESLTRALHSPLSQRSHVLARIHGAMATAPIPRCCSGLSTTWRWRWRWVGCLGSVSS